MWYTGKVEPSNKRATTTLSHFQQSLACSVQQQNCAEPNLTNVNNQLLTVHVRSAQPLRKEQHISSTNN